jgi:hypothetical protein
MVRALGDLTMFNRETRSFLDCSEFSDPLFADRARGLEPQPLEKRVMPAISRFRGIIIRLMRLPYRGLAIYANHGEEEIVMDAGTLEVISGAAPTGFIELVREWALVHDSDLKGALNAVQARRAPCDMAPLA